MDINKIVKDIGCDGFTCLPEPMWFNELAKDRDFARVELIDITPVFDTVRGFVGVFEWKSNTIISIDGDSYTSHMPVYGFSEFTKDGQQCISILTDKW